MISWNKSGKIFDIKRFATEDGPGIRTLIFLKGCPLVCEWCANPESQEYKEQVIYYRTKCVSCGRCIENCSNKAISVSEKYGLVTDPENCKACGICVDVCFHSAREMIGEMISVEDLLEIVIKDKSFYDDSGGGVTLTGGEPFFQPHFTLEILKACKSQNISTAIETCGYTSWENIETVLPYLDLIMYDVKHLDNVLHKKRTGKTNVLIKENLSKLVSNFSNIIVRIPFIPDFNDDSRDQAAIYNFIGSLENVKRIEILPYHRLGMNKYSGLGREYELLDLEPVNKHDLQYLVDIGKQFNVEVKIGGE